MTQTIRTFIAIELDDAIKTIIDQTQKKLKNLDVKVTWVKPHNAHLTLKFLGDVPETKIEKVVAIMRETLSHDKALAIELASLGAFPRVEHPKVLWIGIKGAIDRIEDMVERLETGLVKLHFKKDQKKFSPHITIGRVRSGKNINLISETFEKSSIPHGIRQIIKQITLYKSTLSSEGPLYESLAKVELKEKE